VQYASSHLAPQGVYIIDAASGTAGGSKAVSFTSGLGQEPHMPRFFDRIDAFRRGFNK
jgi:hypothetical protein